ncbi:HD domain-containing protein [Yinghuangia seranimata]|uniref:HD domain-containing protein n=1 Tax=Yinghuangia seranimata TaxID=408067 RepID=UPI00248B15D5|nr:HD domain-containing protein [Yinghuangia seranimata]MDI2130009.1 HD domain-containing protein [Yinghuangia seranimata]
MASEALRRALVDTCDPDPRPLPDRVVDLLCQVDAPPRLAAHLRLVHDVAFRIVGWVEREYPALEFDRDAVLFGAATHDIGKAVHRDELLGPGHAHELGGYELLYDSGVDAELARFACTHGTWAEPGLPVEDLLVCLADKVWKGARLPQLEDRIMDALEAAASPGAERWEAFLRFDEMLGDLAAEADLRLAFQARHPVGVPQS